MGLEATGRANSHLPGYRLDTLSVQAGHRRPAVIEQPAAPPIFQTSVFEFESLERMAAVEAEQGAGPPRNFSYSREANPTVATLERAVADLEGAEDAWAAASGMGAIFTTLWSLLAPGDHVVVSAEVYGGTYRAVTQELARFGVRFTQVDPSDLEAVRAALRPETRVLYVETISNPTLKVADLPALAQLARRHGGCRLVVDNTFASPVLCRPLELGADLVVESATKFLGGHADVTLGVVAGSAELVTQVRRRGMVLGAAAAPFVAWLALRGLKTLALRMRRQSENALELARRLASHPNVEKVYYPGLEPANGAAARVLSGGFGAMVSFVIGDRTAPADPASGVAAAATADGVSPAVARFVRALKLVRLVPSLGEVGTTISHPASSSHRAMPLEQRLRLGIVDTLVRVSVGAEDIEDIWADFDEALRASG